MIDRQPSFAREISQILETRRRVVNTIQKSWTQDGAILSF